MKIYRGDPGDMNWTVTVQEIWTGTGSGGNIVSLPVPLKQRQDLANHSPDGFAWGYGGSGPAQLALALLADAWGDDKRALRAYQHFKWTLISAIPQKQPWVISDTIVSAWGKMCERERQNEEDEHRMLEEAAAKVSESGAPGA